MADYSQGAPPPPPMGGLHSGRIPSFRNNHGDNFQMCGPEPPACVQNAMMTKDKKPFTYTPGGLDLSQIRTPSMARRLNKQQQHQEDLENPAYFRQPSVNGGPSVPAPPPPPPPGPPPPPPLVISVNKPNKAVNDGERPEIVIPENPIGMLRKTHSPYHWESEESNRLQQGSIPKFIEKSATPSPVAPQMRRPPPQQFSQQAPQPSPPHFNQQPPQFNQQPPQFNQQPTQQFSPQISQQSPQTYGHQQPSPQISSRYENNLPQQNNKSGAESPIWKPEPKYPNSPKPNNVYSPVPNAQQNQTPTKDTLQRQDSQFNLSPSPWGKESPFSNASSTTSSSNNQTLSPSCDTSSSVRSTPVSSASPWKQEVRGSPMQNNVKSPVQSPYNDGYRVTPIHIEARDMQVNPNSPAQSVRSPNQSPYVEVQQSSQNAPPWRQQQAGTPNVQPMSPVNNVRVINQNQPRSPTYVQSPSSAYIVKSPSPPKNNNVYSNMQPESDEVRYQSHMTIPVTPRKTRNEDIQEQPVLKLVESPKENLPWVRGQNTVNKAVPPPPWCQRSESRKSLPRDSFDQNDGESPQTPWGQRTLDNRKSLPKEPPQSSEPQPPWVTENRRYETLPRAQPGKVSSISTPTGQIIQHVRSCDSPGRVIPIQMEVTKQDISQNNNSGNAQIKQGPQGRNQQQPQLRIIIDMNQQGQRGQPAQGGPNISFQQTQPQMQQNKPNVSMQQPQQHISRVLTPQLMKMEGATVGSPLRQEPSPNFQQQPKTRIIPIQMEPSSPVVTSPSRRN